MKLKEIVNILSQRYFLLLQKRKTFIFTIIIVSILTTLSFYLQAKLFNMPIFWDLSLTFVSGLLIGLLIASLLYGLRFWKLQK